MTRKPAKPYTPSDRLLGDIRDLINMLRFAETFPDERIVHALRAQLSWPHFKGLRV